MHAEWARAAGRCMETEDGEPVRVVYPGISSGSAGPDYKDAVVSFEGAGVVQGDVELHLCGDDWHRHGHDTDHAYDRVVLHVVGDAGAMPRTRLANGLDAPMAVLDGRTHVWSCSGLPCQLRAERSTQTVREVLTREGIARMLLRAGSVAADVTCAEPWIVLARRITRALGYSANTAAAAHLGVVLTSGEIATSLDEVDAGRRSALLLGMAGLLPVQRQRGSPPDCGTVLLWESFWREAGFDAYALNPRQWRLNGLYPNNSPVRRIVALSELWPRIRRLAARSSDAIDVALEQSRHGADALEEHYRVAGDAYWRCHYDFGLHTRESDLIGVSKAREIVVNALLPYEAAMAMVEGDALRLMAVVRLLSAYPPAAPHVVTRHMKRQLGLTTGRDTAAVQQGLLHVFREYCCRGLCRFCPLGQGMSGSSSAASQDVPDPVPGIGG